MAFTSVSGRAGTIFFELPVKRLNAAITSKILLLKKDVPFARDTINLAYCRIKYFPAARQKKSIPRMITRGESLL